MYESDDDAILHEIASQLHFIFIFFYFIYVYIYEDCNRKVQLQPSQYFIALYTCRSKFLFCTSTYIAHTYSFSSFLLLFSFSFLFIIIKRNRFFILILYLKNKILYLFIFFFYFILINILPALSGRPSFLFCILFRFFV